MKLSIVIVNYNVKYFLEQCLYSVQNALKGISAEIFVVDNNSVDGSCQMVKDKFPQVKLIENSQNVGFSKANNQAIRQSLGEFVLLLNPDTLVEENTFTSCVDYMDIHTDVGGLGVKMIDGKGIFLPESKRGLPTPWVAFCKIFGLSSVFPKSKLFGKYHLGYLSKEEIHEVEILPGAFMLLRRETLNKTGLLDENFFMYGEDIDLSYRILKEGYKNIYYPKTTIVHYKGESTKKGSINYVMVFYNAMIIFAKKHFSQKNARVFSTLINAAIYLRASLSIMKRFFTKTFLPILDAVLIFFSFYFIKPYWEKFKFPDGGTYPDFFLHIVVPGYIIIWLISVALSGGYRFPVKIRNIQRGILIGTFVILVVYALLPESLRFSRALIIIGTLLALTETSVTRYILSIFNIENLKIEKGKHKKRIVIVGEKEEAERVHNILKHSQISPDLIGFVNPSDKKTNDYYIGNLKQLKDIVFINKIEEIIFCAKNLSSQMIIKNMLLFSDINIEYKIASPESLSVIGSNSINTSGDLYSVYFNSIAKKSNQFSKKLFDKVISVVLLLLSPILAIFFKNPINFLHNNIRVIKGSLSLVGYYNKDKAGLNNLPGIRKGILNPADNYLNADISEDAREKLDIIYARDYKISNDFNIIFRAFFKLDRKIS